MDKVGLLIAMGIILVAIIAFVLWILCNSLSEDIDYVYHETVNNYLRIDKLHNELDKIKSDMMDMPENEVRRPEIAAMAEKLKDDPEQIEFLKIMYSAWKETKK